MRKALGILFGIAAALVAIMAIEWIDSAFFSVEQLDSADPAALAAMIAAIPLPAKLLVVFGWFLGAFCGAWLALRVSDWRWAGWIVVAFVLAGGIGAIVSLPNPWWMNVGAVVMPLLGGGLAQRLHARPYAGEPLLG